MSTIDPQRLMRMAIDRAHVGIVAGQTPFGCAIALGDRIVAAAHNCVWSTVDITAHAEITAIRLACKEVGQIHLTGAIVASTCEPCPMCMSALHWARVAKVYYGATIADAAAVGFNEAVLAAADLVRLGQSPVQLEAGLLADECRALLATWRSSAAAQAY